MGVLRRAVRNGYRGIWGRIEGEKIINNFILINHFVHIF